MGLVVFVKYNNTYLKMATKNDQNMYEVSD